MSIPEIDLTQTTDAIAEAELQQELHSLFAIDTQTYLHRYSEIVQSLTAHSWRPDIQELYRCIHTIKGGAVTVGAEPTLQIATVLEDVLADLRYLDQAPALSDGRLCQILQEAGELLTATLDLDGQSGTETASRLHHLQSLHIAIRERYLPQWTEQKQLHQEFAEQGFDMVVLELEIALERLPKQGGIPPATLQTAQQTLLQLQEIGKELQLTTGWTDLLDQAQLLLGNPDIAGWRSHWSTLFQALKASAKQGGSPVLLAIDCVEPDPAMTGLLSLDFAVEFLDLQATELEPAITEATLNPAMGDETVATHETPEINEIGDFLESLDSWLSVPVVDSEAPLTDNSSLEGVIPSDTHQPLLEPVNGSLNNSAAINQLPPELDWTFEPDGREFTAQVPHEGPPASDRPQNPAIASPTKVQIPVPLEKLDQSAQYLVETLLALRSTEGQSQVLQNQLTQLVTLAQEGTQYITYLRQIQDDYALLNQIKPSTTTQGPTLERYRQGYTTLNRLLENHLRLAEIGAEAGKTFQQLSEYLQSMNQNVLKLQTTIADSRLVPFQNLGMRARAILRDLTTRHPKLAQLTLQGEQIELDVETARNLEPVLLHLIRNAYDHGLEMVGDRRAQGKPEQGTLTLSLQRRGNLFQLELKDDGRGIHAAAIHARAKALGLPLISTQTPAELLAVICQPGFSAQSQVSEISGRGVGMDVVAAQVTRLGGRLSLETDIGQGTTFRIQFPVPRLLVPCLLLQVKDITFAIPIDEIQTICLFSDLPTTAHSDARTDQQETPAGMVLDLLQYWRTQTDDRIFPETASCLQICLESLGTDRTQGVWLLADDLLGQFDLLINPLPAPLIAPDGLIGVSLQPNGTLVPVLEAHTLAEQLLANAQPSPSNRPDTADVEPPATNDLNQPILIVDDAALMRRRLESSLHTSGYLTQTCADGLEAWNWLQTHSHPSLVITDIEMPNMDGFTLIDRCRKAGITVPILVISSRVSEEWSAEAKRLGASDYLIKGFSTVELLKRVNTLMQVC
jgi:chemotaxis protein histidine kinase CheA